MNNDLISRKCLKEKLQGHAHNGAYASFYVDDIIDNAPTVEALKDITELHCDITKEQLLNALRPQGKWIVSQTMNCHSDIINIYTCPFCGEKEYSAYPFCHCGAKMKGGAT